MEMYLGEVSSELKKDCLRDYLKETGIIEKLANIFNLMIVSKPENPMDFIRQELGEELVPAETSLELERELDDAQLEIRRLRNILLKLGVDSYDEEFESSCLEDLGGMEEFETRYAEEAPEELEE